MGSPPPPPLAPRGGQRAGGRGADRETVANFYKFGIGIIAQFLGYDRQESLIENYQMKDYNTSLY
jgi:hypothetical protein